MREPEEQRLHRPRPPQLDERLTAAFEMVPSCGICADIGADHGRLSAALLLSGRVQHVLAADVSAKALAKAKARLMALGLLSRATLAVADGLQALQMAPQGRADCICVLGMGGETIAGILLRGRAALQGATLVLGAQTELPLLRQAVCEAGYRIRQEAVAEAAGRFYVLMQATPAAQEEAGYDDRQLLLGPCLLIERPEQWMAVLCRRKQLLEAAWEAMRQASAPKDAARLLEVEKELSYMREVLEK